MSSPYLVLKNLSCERDGRLLIEQLDIELFLGEILQVEGPNGSGKTTLLNVLSTLSPEYGGDIIWQGQNLNKVRFDYLNELIYLGHAAGIKSILSPLENLRWRAALQLGAEKSDEDIFAALAKVKLAGFEHSPCYSLSAGQQR